MSLVRDVLAQSVAGIRVESEFLPPLRLDEPFRQGGPRSMLAKALRPRVLVSLRSGETLQFTPLGAPGPTKWPMVVALLSIVLAWLIYRALRCR